MNWNGTNSATGMLLRWWWLLAPVVTVVTLVAAVMLPPAGRTSWSGAPIPFAAEAPPQDLAGRARVLRDAAGTLSIEAVARLADAAFVPLERDLSPGFDKAAYWVRFTVEAPTDAAGKPAWLEVEMPYLDHVDLYVPDGDGFARTLGGDLQPVSARLLRFRNFVFGLPLPQAGPATYHLRIASTSTIAMKARLWTPEAFASHASWDGILLGALSGAVLIIVLLAVGQAVLLRDRAYALFGLYVFGLTCMHAGLLGLMPFLGLETHPAVSSHLVGVAVCLGAASGVPFILHILNVPRRSWGGWFYRAIGYACVAMAISVPFGGYEVGVGQAVHVLSLIGNLSTCVVAYGPARRGDVMARGYLLGWSFYLAGISLITLRNLGVVATSPLVDWSSPIGLVIQSMLLAIGLAARVRVMEAERHEAQAALLAASHHSERELAARVADRTQSLTAANRAMEEALESERQARTEQRNFFAMVSHEFRTPLAVIGTAAQVVGMSPQSRPDALELDKIQRAVRRMTDLMDSCLTDEWLETAIAAVRDEPVPLDRLLRIWVEEKHRISGRHIQYEAPIFGPVECRGDPVLLGIALSNLVDNAVKYSTPNSPIEVRLRGQDDWLRLAVTNRGPAIPVELRERIFEKFFRAAGHERISGAGLGLHVVQRIAEQHAGWVELACEEDLVCFTLVLPVQPALAALEASA